MEYGPDARIVPKLSAFEGSRKPANKNSHAVPMQQIKNRKVLNFRLPILIYFNNLDRRKTESVIRDRTANYIRLLFLEPCKLVPTSRSKLLNSGQSTNDPTITSPKVSNVAWHVINRQNSPSISTLSMSMQ